MESKVENVFQTLNITETNLTEEPWARDERINLVLNCLMGISLILFILLSIILITNKIKKKKNSKALIIAWIVAVIIFLISIFVERWPV